MSKHSYSYKKYLVYFNDTDVTDMVLCVNMYYDIQSTFMSANIIIMDSNDLLTRMNLTSGEVLVRVEFSCVRYSKEYEITSFYFIDAIKDKVQQNQKTMMYTAACVTDNYRAFIRTRVAKQLTGNAPKLAAELINQYTGITVENSPADNDINMSSNNDTLYNVLSKLVKNSVKNGKAGYLLFQKNNQTMSMIPVDELTESSGLTFAYRIPNTTSFYNSETPDMHTVMKYEVIHPEQSRNSQLGYNGKQTTTYDIMKKKTTKQDVKNTNQVDTENVTNNEQSSKGVYVAASGIQPSAGQLNDPRVHRSTRQMELLRLEQEKVLVQVEGHIILAEMLGKTVILELPVQHDGEYGLDEKRSGEYVLSAMEHSFNRAHYVTNVELTKITM